MLLVSFKFQIESIKTWRNESLNMLTFFFFKIEWISFAGFWKCVKQKQSPFCVCNLYQQLTHKQSNQSKRGKTNLIHASILPLSISIVQILQEEIININSLKKKKRIEWFCNVAVRCSPFAGPVVSHWYYIRASKMIIVL